MLKIRKRHVKKIVVNLLLLIVTILIFFICFEIIVRVLHISTGYDYPKGMFIKDELLDTSLAPNFKGSFIKTEFKTEIFTNSLGMFDVEYYKKEPNDFRLLALGDSFTWGGYGTSLNKTFLKVLERKLNENSSTNYQVMNSGVPGYGTDQEYLYLINKGYKLKPDIVLLNFFVCNDFTDNLRSGETTVKNGYAISTNPNSIKLSNKIRHFLLMNLYSYRIIERSLFNFFGPFIQKHISGKYQNYAEQVMFFTPQLLKSSEWNKTVKLLDNIKNYTASNDIDLVIVLIPLKYQVDEYLKKIFIKNNMEDLDYDMELPQKIINEWGERNNITIVDLLPIFKRINTNNSLYWDFNPHFNEKGNNLAGIYIYQRLIETSLIKNDKK